MSDTTAETPREQERELRDDDEQLGRRGARAERELAALADRAGRKRARAELGVKPPESSTFDATLEQWERMEAVLSDLRSTLTQHGYLWSRVMVRATVEEARRTTDRLVNILDHLDGLAYMNQRPGDPLADPTTGQSDHKLLRFIEARLGEDDTGILQWVYQVVAEGRHHQPLEPTDDDPGET